MFGRKFKKVFCDDFPCFDLVNPEFPAFPRMSRDGFAVLAGDRDS